MNELMRIWGNRPDKHAAMHETLCEFTNSSLKLKALRDWVEAHAWGFGERSFYWMWLEIIFNSPDNFNFLEIGVYRGQVLALIRTLSDMLDKQGTIIGISPLSGEDGYIEQDYHKDVIDIHEHFNLELPTLIKGLSTDSQVISRSLHQSPYDVVYIDGGHSYEVVKQDMEHYLPQLKRGGFLVMDDCCNKFDLPDGYFRGHESVSKAVDEVLPPFAQNPNFEFLFSVVHNRVWRKK